MPTQKSAKYRAQAAKVREEAEKTVDAQSRKGLLDIAKQYERLAEWAERRGGSGDGP
jgi:hypothetical protein